MRDLILGTPGRDHIDGTGRAEQIEGRQRADTLAGGGGGDILRGQGGADHLEGNGGNDLLSGGAGDDFLQGDVSTIAAIGNDVLLGGGGDDILVAPTGSDRMTGGAGADVFAVSVEIPLPFLGRVVVTDLGAEDRLRLFLSPDADEPTDPRAALDTNGDGRIDAGDDHSRLGGGGLVLELGEALDAVVGSTRDTPGTLVLSGLDHLDVSAIG